MKLPHDAPLKTVQVNRLRLVESKQSVRALRTRQVGGPAIEPPIVVQERGPSGGPSFSTSWAAWLRAQQPIPAASCLQSGEGVGEAPGRLAQGCHCGSGGFGGKDTLSIS